MNLSVDAIVIDVIRVGLFLGLCAFTGALVGYGLIRYIEWRRG